MPIWSPPGPKKCLPDLPVHDCTDCDGIGASYDEDGVRWKCEGCQGSGRTTSCRDCKDPMPLPEAEMTGYHCPQCIAEAEYVDRDSEVERLRRMG